MKSIKKWCEKQKWLLGGIAAIQGIGNLLMDIFNKDIVAYLTITFVLFMILVDYIKNTPNYEFLLTGDDKPRFLRLERDPLFMTYDLISFLPDEETRKKAKDKKWSRKKVLRKLKKIFKNP